MLYSLGFNAFQQLSSDESTAIHSLFPLKGIDRILLASWESTFALTEQNQLEVLGFQPRSKDLWYDFQAVAMFGDPVGVFGFVDRETNVWLIRDGMCHHLTTDAKDAVYCAGQNRIYVLQTVQGRVEVFDLNDLTVSSLLNLPPVIMLASSTTHVLFYTRGSDPIYALGSNRFSQLGMDFHTVSHLDDPQPVDFFCGLGSDHENGMVACGPFHSAVILDNTLYTFGWRKYGRLGWHTEDDAVVGLPSFLDNHSSPVDVDVVKVACGSNHTIVLDDQGTIWTCGSDKYGQLGRPVSHVDKYEDAFRACEFQDQATNCDAGRWSSFIYTASA
ncbi:regulator of chromosome condensation 1/beta-lactamase-inhibitor protein II [Radiomyces spectabilis]|uniref:regulator of chromosome condensation 1/beta-lactamase-inhibitor protein II n=1 Tax=Radiomyces spectabilis TaxID=64574 RepID=UPI00222053C1|nr:regulator of chromosome condensation 1/beta-lactamase-inhibitor protein II [Radiomyces spectabilis]KAI8375987.1 regulator of chromosome condensation 1/beta-lactamase-inhibitor protein II [Radiomyces spectabilis]